MATQALAFPGPVATVTVTVAPGATVVGATVRLGEDCATSSAGKTISAATTARRPANVMAPRAESPVNMVTPSPYWRRSHSRRTLLVRQPGDQDDLTHGFASPPLDGFAFCRGREFSACRAKQASEAPTIITRQSGTSTYKCKQVG